MVAVEAPFVDRFDLGEGPHWNAATRTLGFVDIDAGEIHDLDPETGDVSTISLFRSQELVSGSAGRSETSPCSMPRGIRKDERSPNTASRTTASTTARPTPQADCGSAP
jgi:sugar lactone lactonase YvrE